MKNVKTLSKLFLRPDLLKHFFIGFFIYLLASLVAVDSFALFVVILIGTGKEIIWDYALKKGTPEIIDAVYTILPAILMYFIL